MTPFTGTLELEGGSLVRVSGEIGIAPPEPSGVGDPGPARGILVTAPGGLGGATPGLMGRRARLLVDGQGVHPVTVYAARHYSPTGTRFEFVADGPPTDPPPAGRDLPGL